MIEGIPRTVLLVSAGVLAFGLIGYLSVGRGMGQRRGELEKDVADVREESSRWQAAVDQQPQLAQEIDGFVERTLGGDVEMVDHRLRTRLNRIAEELQLADISVGTGAATGRRSPARAAMSRRGPWRGLRDELDFVEVEGTVSAGGSLEQVLRLAHAIESERWIKRVEQMRLDPSPDGQMFTISLRVRTLFLPGREPEMLPLGPEEEADFAAYAALAAANPFRVTAPAPAPPPAPETVTQVPPPPRFPYGQWLVTGGAQGPGGPEVWLRNHSSGETKLLALGDEVGDASLVEALGETARFQVGEREFVVLVGHAMNDRRSVGEPGG